MLMPRPYPKPDKFESPVVVPEHCVFLKLPCSRFWGTNNEQDQVPTLKLFISVTTPEDHTQITVIPFGKCYTSRMK